MSNQQLVRSVRKSLSPGRLGTYETASGVTGDEDLTALNLGLPVFGEVVG
jgi:hypothetical protein